MELSQQHLEELLSLEEAMWIAETRGDPSWFAEALAPNFTEHGASGRVWDRDTIMTIPISGNIPVELPFPNLAIRAVTPTVALITYVSILDGAASNRASLWRHNGTKWQLEFHQGTPIA